MRFWKVILATLVIFGTGVITGALVVNLHYPAEARPLSVKASATSAPPLQIQRKEFFQRMKRELKLRAEQQQRVEQLIHESQQRTQPLWDQVAPQMRDELRAVKEKIRAELDPDQQAKFEELFKPRNPRKPEELRKMEERRERTPQRGTTGKNPPKDLPSVSPPASP